METKISIIVPNYNGRNLLAKNLPLVIKYCRNCEIIVVDDASEDDSADFLKKEFKNINLIQLPKNIGFARAINKGVAMASGDLIVLLNSDVSPRADFLKKPIGYFNDKEVFAVGLSDQSHEAGKIVIRGKGGASFIRGFLDHYALESKFGETLWVSGGSGVFDKGKFMKLGGFDDVFSPFYWEDIDLSWRAWRNGFKCLFEPDAKVDHYHEEGAIKSGKSSNFIKTVSYKNQFLFVWKNFDDYVMIFEHLAWLPFNFAKAAIFLNWTFIIGFLWALILIPKLIISDHTSQKEDFVLSEREVLAKFERP